jgi:hypothetical protein
MSQQRQRPILIGIGALLLVWLLAWGGYVISKHSKMTAVRVRQFQNSLDLSRLSAADRLKALKALADKVNGLSPEERQHWQLDLDWFALLTDDEKAFFIDAFMPGEMQMALRMFEQWPKERQQEEIDKAFKDLRARAANPGSGKQAMNGTNGPLFSPELDKKIRTMGLNTLFNKGSSQTKADLAPLLMEVQRQFESGNLNLNNF